jgi:subtilase family serine protease
MIRHRYAFPAALTMAALLTQSALGQGTKQTVSLGIPVPPAVRLSTMTGHTDPSKMLHMSVSLPFGDADGMQQYVDDVSNPASPHYREYLTPDQVGERYGLPYNQVQAVAGYFSTKGLKVELVGKNRLSILVTGTVAQAEVAFSTKINNYKAASIAMIAGNREFFSYSVPPSLPGNIAPYVSDVTGLESNTKPQRRAVLNPTQARTLYNLAPAYNAGLQGQGRTIAISNWDGFRLSNLPLYYSQYNLPTPAGGVGSNVHVVTISGGAGSGSPGAEGDLDIQMVLGMAPLCNFYVYDGGASDLIGVLTREVNDNLADVISESWGWSLPASTATSAHNLHLSMSAQGITYMAASGDSGTSLEPYSYPDYEPEVLSVGGTIATFDASGNRTGETGWSGSGGGYSTNTATFNVRPSWQVGTGVPTSINKRLVPDVAIHASGGTSGAYYFYLNGSLTSGYVGTSFACPVFAGQLGVAEQKIIGLGGLPPNGAGKQRFGRIQDVFYGQNGRSDVWHDITSGANGSLPNGGGASNCTANWDTVTGWGAINWDAFVNTQVNQTPDFTISASPSAQTVTQGGGTNYTATLAAVGGFSGTETLSVSGLPSGASATFTPASVAGSGTSTMAVSTLSSTPTGTYTLTVTGTSGSLVHSTTVSLTVNPPAAPDFSISASPASQSVVRGGSVNYTATITGSNGFAGTTALSVSGLPSGISASFSPSSVTGNGSATMTVSTAPSTKQGTYTLTVRGTSGSLTHTTTVTLQVRRR